MEGLYTIVEWMGTNEVPAVQTSWLTDDCDDLWSCWPSSAADEDRPVKHRWEPKKNWCKYRIKQIGRAG